MSFSSSASIQISATEIISNVNNTKPKVSKTETFKLKSDSNPKTKLNTKEGQFDSTSHRSFLNHNSFPNSNTDNYSNIHEYMEDNGSDISESSKNPESNNENERENESKTEEGYNTKNTGILNDNTINKNITEINLEDTYDLDKSRSPDPSKFESLDAQLRYELEKCLQHLKPNNKTSKTIKSNVLDPESTNNLKQKNNDSNYTYLSVQESIELTNKREYTLISIDNEFFERATSKVTEIGISIYNPTYQKFALFPHFFHIHFIIKEFINLRNGVFVPDSKMNNITGQSIIISKNNIGKAMSLIFEILGPKICIVGHNVSGDINSFKHLSYKIPTKFKVIDTVKLWYSFIGNSSSKSSLSFILDKLGVPNAFLHNGVNDAYYTLVVCLILTSPELINNLIFKKKPTIVETPVVVVESPTPPETKQDPPDFSEFPPDVAEVKMKRWLRKMKKSEEKAKKKQQKGDERIDNYIRCSVDNSVIAQKNRRPNSKHPPVNRFFKPVVYDETELNKKLKELHV